MESTSLETDLPADADASGAADLESRLREKEQLVAVLTERLEQAAEQLDRNRRTGADRGMRISGGMPPELIEQQKTLSEDLGKAVDLWGDMQVPATLGRIEIQITELRDLVSSRTTDFAAHAPGMMSSELTADPGSKSASVSNAETPDGESPGSWAALKAGLLEADDAANVTSESDETSTTEEPAETIDEVGAPEVIDWDTAETDALREAVQERDDYIDYLLKKLRRATDHQRTLPDWESLDNAPEELKTELQQLADRFEEGLRFAEVQSSLERARLGREQSRLDAQQVQIERTAKRMGINLDGQSDDASKLETSNSDESAQGSRWLRMLGMNRGEASNDK